MMIHFNILINFVNKDICYHIQDIIANKLLRYKRQIHIYHLSNILNLMKKNDLSFKVLILLLTLYLPPIYLSGQIDWSTNMQVVQVSVNLHAHWIKCRSL